MIREIDVRWGVCAWLAGLCLLGCVPAAFALGLGGMDVDSALGEPLDARIMLLSVMPSERRSLRARLADAQVYADYGVKRAAIIDSINVTVRDRSAPNGGTVLRLTTSQPVSAPLLELLVVARTGSGRAVRKYAALISPTGTQAPASASPEVVYHPRDGSATTVRVGAKQTLWSISKRNKYADVSIQQMLIAIYRANPSAFEGGINSMKVGSTLVMPAHDKVSKLDPDWADNWVDGRS